MGSGMNERIDTQGEFSLMREARSFAHAGKGLLVFFRTTPHAWVHSVIFAFAILLGFIFHITRFEWITILFAGGFVFVAEAFNTAIEIDINLTSPTYHPYARDTKDVAAGAVLLAAMTAVLLGCIVFVPYIGVLLKGM
jgi:diacylglycerol kinase (ATP)